MLKIVSGIAMATGLLIMAGSAGDCDGACIDQANSMSEMITYVTIGLALFAGGAITLIKSA